MKLLQDVRDNIAFWSSLSHLFTSPLLLPALWGLLVILAVGVGPSGGGAWSLFSQSPPLWRGMCRCGVSRNTVYTVERWIARGESKMKLKMDRRDYDVVDNKQGWSVVGAHREAFTATEKLYFLIRENKHFLSHTYSFSFSHIHAHLQTHKHRYENLIYALKIEILWLQTLVYRTQEGHYVFSNVFFLHTIDSEMWRDTFSSQDYIPYTHMLTQTYGRKIHLRVYFILGCAGINVKIWVWQLRRTDAQALHCCSLSCSCSSGKIAGNNVADGVNHLFCISEINHRQLCGPFKCTFLLQTHADI